MRGCLESDVKIGILSDSHGRTKRLASALKALLDRGAEAVVHCGDICAVECLEALCACGVPAHVVAGNMDRHVARLQTAAARGGANFAWEVIEVDLGDGRRLAATHGSDEAVLEQLVSGGQFAYVCHGHTHRRRDERIGAVRVINPGALYHPRDGKPTVALLDCRTDQLEFLGVG